MTDPNLPDQPGTPVPPAAAAYGQPAASPAAPAYGETAPAYGQAPSGAKTNTLAIVSLVASIAGFFTGIGYLVGIVCGHISLSQIKKTGEQGRGMAIAGLIIGYVGIVLYVVGTILLIVFFAALAASGQLDTTNY